MQKQSTFIIYNASAGSGKTFTLVKDYLKILFESKSPLAFRYILALTFTNKAVGEMKVRIIDTLKLFADKTILNSPNSMSKVLVKELDIELQELHNKSKILLERIVHNYAAFDISTIDKFNHKLIRTFAHDLKLPVNFEVELDTATMLAKAVDKLIDKAGSNDELTKLLVDFAIEKTDDHKSWDISYDFNSIAQLLINENEIPYLNQLKDKSLSDFKALKSNLKKRQKAIESQIVDSAKTVLNLIKSNGLEFDDFTRKTLPNHFKKASELDFYRLYDNKLQDNITNNTSLYNKTLNRQKASRIDSLLPQIESNYNVVKRLVFTYKFLRNALKNMTPLSVLSAIAKMLKEIKDEDDLLLISEFNSIINDEIKMQPAPFIYERLGEKFKHYFIDEFQDTSVLQWENLLPLINNATSGVDLNNESGTAMLVGDAKQAIYRWRGGRAEQFIDLYTEKVKPLAVEQKVRNLPTNYRSHSTIVDFNNTFFNHIADFAFSDTEHQYIYKNAKQDVFLEQEGYVKLSFLETDDEDKNKTQCDAVLNTIKQAKSFGFSLKDICIIVRKTKEGIAISEFLSDSGIAIISSETLLLKNSPEVQFLNHLIALSLHPNNDEIKTQLLSFIAENKLQLENKHEFFERLVHLQTIDLFDKINEFGFEFNFIDFLQLPIYEAVESVIRGFQLNQASNAYLQFYLDEIFDYSQKYNASFSGFLEYWDRKKDKLSIVSPSGKDAIQIMTIHKSKGLEFPVVIFPFANQNIYADINPKVWFPANEKEYEGFSDLYINLNKDLEEFNEKGALIYNEYRSQLELDSINLLYVVLTRAVEQLYIISEYDVDKAQNEKLTHYSGLFINYLKSIGEWKDNQLQYSFGVLNHHSEIEDIQSHTLELTQFISSKKEDYDLNIITTSGYLWDTAQEKAIDRGNLVHQIMSFIKTEADVEFTLNQFLDIGTISSEQRIELKQILHSIIKHQLLEKYFKSDLTIYNEKDIISKTGKLLRPDRVVINSKNQATIMDYKTGLQDSSHKEQLFDYQYVLEDMNFEVIKKILIYINDDIVVKEF